MVAQSYFHSAFFVLTPTPAIIKLSTWQGAEQLKFHVQAHGHLVEVVEVNIGRRAQRNDAPAYLFAPTARKITVPGATGNIGTAFVHHLLRATT